MPGGRPCIPNTYSYVTHYGKTYLVGSVVHNGSCVQFVCDIDDEKYVRLHNWCVIANNYLGYSVKDPETNKRKTVYMHNLIMGRTGFQGKGQLQTVDHINGVGFDNRRINLRLITSSLQNRNRSYQKRKLNTKLPECIVAAEIPRNVWYMPANGSHGDRFAIEFKGIPGIDDVLVKTTAKKSVSTHDKLNEAIRIRDQYLQMYPELVEYSRESEKSETLRTEYEAIVSLTKFE